MTSFTKINDPLLAYPVGSIYMSVNSTNPSTLFGGTWERIQGRFLLAATDGGAAGGNSNASIAAGNTGGEAAHTITPGETALKNHTHGIAHTHTMPHTHTIAHTHNLSGYVPYTISGFEGESTDPLNGSTYKTVRYKTTSDKVANLNATLGSNTANSGAASTSTTASQSTSTSGGLTEANGSAHNNMPPYLAVYVWKRMPD